MNKDIFVCEKDAFDRSNRKQAIETSKYILNNVEGDTEEDKYINWIIGTDGYWGDTPTRLMTYDFISKVLKRFPFAYKLLPDKYKTDEVKKLISFLRPDYLDENSNLELFANRLVEYYFDTEEDKQNKENEIFNKLKLAGIDKDNPELLNKDLIKKIVNNRDINIDSLDISSLKRLLNDLNNKNKEDLNKFINDDKIFKYRQPISLQADNGQWYYIVPNTEMKDILNQRIHNNRYLDGVTRQRGLNNSNRLALHYGQQPEIDKDLQGLETQNAKILTYADYERNPELQLELGSKLLQFYKDKNIPNEERTLSPYNAGVLKRYIAHRQALDNDPEYKKNIWNMSGKERDIYQKDYLKNAIRKTKKYSNDLSPISAEVPRADDVNEKNIILNIAKNKLKSLNPQDREMFNRVQKVITGPFITKQSPSDLLLLLNNFKNLEVKSKNDDDLRDNWRKLQMSQYESIYTDLIMYDTKLFTEGAEDYQQRVIFKILQSSGVYFSPTHLEYLSNLKLFQDHWQDIPVQGRTNIQIKKSWDELVEKYWLWYYIPLLADELKEKGILDSNTPVDIENTIDNLRKEITNVFEFIQYTNFKDKKRLVYKAITGEDLDQAKVKASLEKNNLKKDKDQEDLIAQAMHYYKQNKESKYEQMITKVLQEQLNN